MKKGSIFRKIQRKILFGAVTATLTLCIAAIVCIMVMRGNIITSGQTLGTSAADDSKLALEAQMQISLSQLAQNMAAISDEKLAATAGLIRVLSENTTAIASNPGRYMPVIPDFPNPANVGRTVAQLRLPEGMDFQSVEDEIGLLGNISNLLISQVDSLDHVGSTYIGSERGVSISADVYSDLKTNVFDPRTRGWYNSAKEAGGLIWTDVFADNSGRGLSISCAMPFYGADGSMRGVVGAGMLLEVLDGIVLDTKIGETGYAFIASGRGDMIISDMVTIEGGVVQSPNLSDFLPLETAERIIGGQEGIERASIDGIDCFIAYAPLNTLSWSLAVVMSVEEVISPALESEEHIIGMTGNMLGGIDRIILITLGVFAAALILTLIGNTVLARRLAAGLARPIIDLSQGAEIIGSGDLDYRLNVKTGDELEALSDAFNAMIANVKVITSEKERIGAELDVATGIQANMLPSIFPAFPERMEFDIFANMRPAKEVGGDFYDFFLVDDDTLAFIIADVSDKGVPAALFMVIAKTLIKNNAQSGKSPKEVFETVNNLLCENNEADMFVTAFLGYLDIPSGRISYVNAGHNPPFIRTGGEFCRLSVTPNLALACMEDMPYRQHEVTLHPGDELFLYTDGLTEAMNREDELFGEARLLGAANNHYGLPLSEFAMTIKDKIDEFAEGTVQTDDMTILVLRVINKEDAEEELIIDANLDNLDMVLEFVGARLHEFDVKTKNQIIIAVDEVFSNIALYAYGSASGSVTVRICAGNDIMIEFEDSGIPYNPLLKDDPDITLSAEDRDIGGLGIFMVKNVMDCVEYRREGDKNILTIMKKTAVN